MREITFIAGLALPLPWPVPKPACAIKNAQHDLLVEVWYSDDARIIIRLLDKEKGNLVAEISSPAIRISNGGMGRVILTLTYSEADNEIVLRLNGRPVVDGDGPIELTGHARVFGEDKFQTQTNHAEIKACLAKRAQRLQAYTKQQGRTPDDLRARRQDMRREIRLLSSAVEHLRMGNTDYIVSASIHLRKLMGDGKGDHLLQDCASIDEAPLPVWRLPKAANEDWSPLSLDPVFWQNWQPLFTYPNGLATEKTDLDAWLDDVAFAAASKPYTHRELIKTIADKIGAHADFERAVVDLLDMQIFNSSSAVEQYILNLAPGVIELAKGLDNAEWEAAAWRGMLG